MDTTARIHDIAELTERVRRFVQSVVTVPRYEHSVRVAQMAEQLCVRFGADGALGYFAGIAHDMCKDMDGTQLLEYAARDGRVISRLEMERLSLLHGRAAAMLLRDRFGVTHPDVLEAVAVHTFGAVGMGHLAKVLYVADKIEPGRRFVTDAYRARLSQCSLDELVRQVVRDSIAFVLKQGEPVAPESQALLESLEV
ncbi:MAG: bis(5'-nucleosyl)-tetraphosphatase (symmetrical) YqeK [Treponema sp.]|nr:bis(5'-nucleosyl)-tetraphosphatase (symmetrical) YqeK [Treponema sp.]